MSLSEVVVVSAVRTAVGDFGGSLKDIPPCDLAAKVVAACVERAGLSADAIQHVVFGNVIHTEARDMYLARVAALNAGLDQSTPALTLNRLCGSGLQAIISAAQLVRLGDCDVAVAGGAESMSRSPHWAPGMRFGTRMGDSQLIDAMVAALHDPFDSCHMGVTAENIAKRYSIDREQQDAYAVESHRRAAAATAAGEFTNQILPIEVRQRRETVQVVTDEHIRADADMASLGKLRPAFDPAGSVTAGNSSGINDAAAALVLMSKAAADERGIKPMATLVDYAFAGVDPRYMGIGPVPATRSLLEKTGLTVADIDVFEVNEAFAAQALAVIEDLELPADKVNPQGSGISIGHPIGATGSMISVKALHRLEQIDGRYALVTMCIGGGQGIAALYRRD